MALTWKFKPHPTKSVFTGTFIHTPSLGKLAVLQDAIIGVENGVISFIEEDFREGRGRGRDIVKDVVKRRGWRWGDVEWVEGPMDGHGWFFPGFVDSHIHAPQYPNTGLFGNTTLLDWLRKYTFPLESSLSSLSRARHIYNRVIDRTLAHGTTAAAYYTTIHVPATNLLSSLCLERGQRAKIGRVCMDSDHNEKYYKDENAATAIEKTKETIQYAEKIDPKREIIEPIVTPRFAPSCTRESLSGLGTLAKEGNLPIQTHISENPDEITLVAQLFPECRSYTDVYAYNGLLTHRTVLGHAIHLSKDERNMVKAAGAGIAHCPVSNSYLSSGLCPVRELLDMGITVGLGTDMSGGWSPSILVAAREALGVSRVLASVRRDAIEKDSQLNEHEKEKRKKEVEHLKLSVEEVLYLATVGGAKCLGLESKLGTFEVGKEFDAQMIVCGDFKEESTGEGYESAESEGGGAGKGHSGASASKDKHPEWDNPVELWGKESWPEKMAKWLFCGDDRNVRGVWVRGKKVHESASSN